VVPTELKHMSLTFWVDSARNYVYPTHDRVFNNFDDHSLGGASGQTPQECGIPKLRFLGELIRKVRPDFKDLAPSVSELFEAKDVFQSVSLGAFSNIV
jgi:hypothetical protein